MGRYYFSSALPKSCGATRDNGCDHQAKARLSVADFAWLSARMEWDLIMRDTEIARSLVWRGTRVGNVNNASTRAKTVSFRTLNPHHG